MYIQNDKRKDIRTMTKRYNVKDMKDMIMVINDEKELMDLYNFIARKIKANRMLTAASIKHDLKVNTKVEWYGKRGHGEGTVVKVNRTRAQVRDTFGTVWNIPMSMLKITK
jgi:hypothetical protein